ncbi:MAG: CPBP family intramembrane metalloprotease, partial [Firmicutes bacterium]|nr:CPBP family intramembrane metalloprotease [Bacillota bacterium]
FGILHFTSISLIFNAIVMGLAFGYMYVKKDNLALSMTMHAILNCVVVMKSYFGLL